MKQKNIEMIDIGKLVPCKWGTGIRDQEVFERLKINIKTTGILNSPIRVISVENGKYMPYIGDHRLQACKDLGWGKIPCIVDEITEQQALERCIADNVIRANYSAVELENKVYELKQSGHYNSNEEIGNVMGLTKQRIGQLLIAKEDRDRFNEMLEKDGSKESLQMGTQVIIDSRPLIDENERFQLLKLVQKGKIKSGDTKMVAENLVTWDTPFKNSVLYQGENFYTVRAQMNIDSTKALKKRKGRTIKADYDASFVETLYEEMTLGLHTYLMGLDVGSEHRERQVNYLKFSIAFMSEQLYYCKKITREQFEQIRDGILGLFRQDVYNYGGEHLQTGIESWGGKKSKKEGEDTDA